MPISFFNRKNFITGNVYCFLSFVRSSYNKSCIRNINEHKNQNVLSFTMYEKPESKIINNFMLSGYTIQYIHN